MQKPVSVLSVFIFLSAACLCLFPALEATAVGTLSGTVRDSTGNPLAGAYVQANEPDLGHWYYESTDGAGVYTFSSVNAGEYYVRAHDDHLMGQYYGGVTYPEEGPPRVAVTDGGTTSDIDITLLDGYSISGTVTEATTGIPIENVSMNTNSPYGPSLWWDPYANTDATGQYRLGGLPAGEFTLFTHHDDYITNYYDNHLHSQDADLISLMPGQNVTGINFVLRPGGVLRAAAMDQSGLPAFDPSSGTLPHQNVLDLVVDSNNDLWLATPAGIMSIVDGVTRGLNSFNSDLPDDFVRALAADGSGNRYYATDGGMVKHSGDTLQVYHTGNSTMPSNHCSAVLVHPDGHIYFGTEDSYFTKWNGTDSFTSYSYSARSESASTPIHCIGTRGVYNEIFIGTNVGVSIFEGTTNLFVGSMSTSTGLPSNQVNAIAGAADGTLWVGTTGGLYRVNPSAANQTYTTSESLVDNNVSDLYVIDADHVWIATYGGISYFNTGAFTNYTTSTSPNLYTNTAYSIGRWQGETYIGQNQGLDIFDGAAFRHISRQYLGVTLYAHNTDLDITYSNYSNSQLGIDIRRLPTGNYRLYSYASYYPRMYYDGVFFETQATLIPITEGQPSAERHVLEFQRYGSISGSAWDHLASPLSSGTVDAYPVADLGQDYSASVSAGAYALSSLSPGDYYVCLRNSSYPTLFYPGVFRLSDATPISVQADQETPGIDFNMLQADNGTISGSLFDSSGNPYQFVNVTVNGVLSTNAWGYATSDMNGDYSVAVQPGNYRVFMSPSALPIVYHAGTFEPEAADRLELASGATLLGADIAVPAFSPGEIRGVVQDQYGNPIPDAQVSCNGRIGYPNTMSDASGNYEFSGLTPYDSYQVNAWKTNYLPGSAYPIEVAPGTTVDAVTVTLEEFTPAFVRGIVRSASGQRIWDAQIRLEHHASSHSHIIYSDWHGNYRLQNFPVGEAEISVSADGYVGSTTPSVTLSPGTNVFDFTLDFDTSSSGTIWGRVRDKNGIEQPGLYVRASGNTSRSARTNLRGIYVLPSLTPGTYSVEVDSFPSDSSPVTGLTVASGDVLGNVLLTVDLELGRISGQVTDSGMTPIPYPNVNDSPIGHNRYPIYTYSAHDGTYVVCGVQSGQYRISASEEGYQQVYYDGAFDSDDAAPVTVTGSDETSGIDITLPDGEIIRGTVTDRYGHPLSGCSVQARHLEHSSRSGYDYTDSFGQYEINTLAAGPNSSYVTRNNYYQEYFNNRHTAVLADPIQVVTGTPRVGVDYQIGVGGTLSGQVTDDSAVPYTSGNVYFYHISDTNSSLASVNLDATGEYRREHLKPGPYYVRASVSGKPNMYYQNAYSLATATQVLVQDEKTKTGIDFVVPATIENATLAGTMYDETGAPYKGVSVRIVGVDGTSGSYYATTSSTDGTYMRGDVPPGSYVVALRESNLPEYYYGDTYDEAGATRVNLNPGETAAGIDVTAPVKDYASVSGTVVDSLDQPVNGVYVRLSRSNVSYSMTTAPDGKFVFSQVFPTDDYTLSAEKAGYYTTQQGLSVPAGGAVSGIILTVTSYDGGAIAGTVSDTSGHPIESAYISFLRLTSPSYSDSLNSDRYGGYFQDNLPPGDYSLYCSANGYLSRTHSPVTVTGGNTTPQDIVLSPSTSSGMVSGTITDASGRPAYRIRVRSEGPSYQTAYTLADGTYKLVGLNPGTYRIYLSDESAPGNEQTGVTVIAGQVTSGIDFTLNVAYGTISGTVSEAGSGDKLPYLSVRARPYNGGNYSESVSTGKDGNYIIGRLSLDTPEGFRLWCSGGDYVTQYWQGRILSDLADPVDLGPSGAATGKNFTMRPGAIIRGKLTDEKTGALLRSGSVYAYHQTPYGTPSYSDSLNPTGWYEITSLPGGDYKLYFSATGYLSEYYNNHYSSSAANIITMATGSIRNYSAKLTRAAVLSGRVVSTTGVPVTDGRVYAVREESGESFYDWLDSNGDYIINTLFPGSYRVRVESTEFLTEYHDNVYDSEKATLVSFATGENKTIDFEVAVGGRISGHVEDSGGSPLTSGTIYAYPQPSGPTRSVGIQSNGNYLLQGLFGGDYKVRAYVSGYVQEYWDDQPDQASGDIIHVVTGTLTPNIDFSIEQGGGITGTVVDASGNPYTSGTVYLSRPAAPETNVYSDGLDGSGVYTLSQVRAGNYYVYLYLSGKPRIFYPYAFTLTDAQQVTITEGSTLTGVNFTVPQSIETANVSGRVTRDGAGVYGRAYIKGVDGFTGSNSYWTNSETGEYNMTNRPAGTYVVYADVENFPKYYYGDTEDEAAATRIILTPGETLTDVDIHLPIEDPDYGSVSGVVYDDLSRPLLGAAVSLDGVEDYDTTSALDGSFLFSQVLPGEEYSLEAAKQGYYPDEITGITVSEGGSVTGQVLTLTGYTGGTIAGHIYNASGYLLTDVYTSASDNIIPYEQNETNDYRGEYRHENLPPGVYRLYFSRSYYQYQYVYDVPVQAGQTVIQDVTLEFNSGTGTVSGTVTDASGHPVYRVYVRAGSGVNTYTDPQGKYFLAGLSPALDERIYCPYEPDIPEVTGVSVLADRVTEGIDFVLPVTYATLSGTITDVTGSLVDDATVRGQAVASSPGPDTAYSTYDGTYLLPRVRTDGGRTYRCYAEKVPYSRTYHLSSLASASATLIALSEGESHRSGIDIVLLDGGAISGEVENQAGTPLVDCDVWVSKQDGDSYSTTFDTDEGGRYLAQGLSPGRYILRARLNGYVTEYYDDHVTADAADELTVTGGTLMPNIDFTLQTGRSMTGRVTDSGGLPLSSASVYVDQADISECEGNDKTNADGEYEVTGLYPDTYRVRAQRSGYVTEYKYDVDTSAGSGTSGIDFVLYRTGEGTPTPTNTPGGPTVTPRPTITPGGPTPTPTSTPGPGDFDKDGDVDPSDLMEMIEELRQGGQLTDMNGDGKIDYRDIILFSKYWDQ